MSPTARELLDEGFIGPDEYDDIAADEIRGAWNGALDGAALQIRILRSTQVAKAVNTAAGPSFKRGYLKACDDVLNILKQRPKRKR